MIASTPLASSPNLKVLIVSTPKTGNTWLKHLIGAMYQLPLVTPQLPFLETEYARFGERWVGHQHFWPFPAVLHWARQNRVHLLTTVRHPADVLVSLYHYVHTPAGQIFNPGGALLLADAKGIGTGTRSYVEKFFFTELLVSLAWLYSGKSHIVRYEALWHDPVAVLAGWAARVAPVPLESIERAVEQSHIDLLRRQHNPDGSGRFFRRGDSGGWHTVLPTAIVDAFRRPPYPTQFSALGYSLDASPPEQLTQVWPDVFNPFREITNFDNGVGVPAVAIRMYLSFETSVARQRWPRVAETSTPDSFFAWLNAPADSDPNRLETRMPLVSNLLLRLYHDRIDLVETFPDIYGTHRLSWLLWFLNNALIEFELNEAFMAPVLESMIAWSGVIIEDEATDRLDLPPLTNLAMYAYNQRPDVRAVYSDLNGLYRVDFLLWFIVQTPKEKELPLALIEPTRQAFLKWANAPDPRDVDCPLGSPHITRWAAHAHRKHPNYHNQFPDLYGADRVNYLSFFVTERTWFAEGIQSLAENWARASLNRPSASEDVSA